MALTLLYLFFALGSVFAKPSFASSNLVERPADELLILELYINDNLRDRSLIGYLPSGQDERNALLPLGALSRKLSFAIDVDTDAGLAQGWFIREDNQFQLDIGRQLVFIKGEEFSYPAEAVETHYDDIYVRADIIEDWFGLEVLPDTGEMRVDVDSVQELPFEAEEKRAKRAEKIARAGAGGRQDFSNAKLIPYKGFSLPNIITQVSGNVLRSREDVTGFGGYSLQTRGDVLGFGTRFVVSGSVDQEDGHDLQGVQLTFNKQDPGRNLLGPLQAGSYAFGDVDFPDVPLAISRRRGRGFSVSSNSIVGDSTVFNPEVTVIDGDGPLGWDVELYRNGFFIAFEEVGDDGRYAFEDVELIRGFNLFEIVLYGPEGQKQVQNQRIVRGARMLQAGEVSYDFALGQPETEFIPLEERDNRDNAFGTSGQFFYGVRNGLTLGANLFHGKDTNSTIDDAQTAGTLSAITSFLGFRTQLQLLRATEGRSGYDIETTTRFKGANLTLGHTTFDGFNNNDRRTRHRSTVALNKNFGAFSASVSAEKAQFLENDDETSIDTTLSTKILGIDLTNRLERTLSDNTSQDSFDGELAAAVNLWDWRVRGNVDYNLDSDANDRIENFRISGLKKFSNDHSLRLNADHAFSNDLSSADIRYTRQIKDVSLDFNVRGDTENNYSAGVTLRTALQADNKGQYEFVNVREGNSGAVGLRAYVDENKNNLYDEGEQLLSGIKFRSNRKIVEDFTDENGVVTVRDLRESATRFTIDEDSLPSIYLKPETDYVDVIPRVGATATVDLAFTQLGEIDGFVYAFEKGEDGQAKGAPGIEVRLFDVVSGQEIESTDSEYDGYYIFSAIPLSMYRLEVVPAWGDSAPIPSRDIVLDQDNSTQLDVNFILEPRDLGREVPVDIRAEAIPVVADIETAAGGDVVPNKPGLFIQLSALRNAELAQGEAERYQTLFSQSVSGAFEVREAVVKGQTYYRVLYPVPSRSDGQALCRQLKASGAKACYPVTM